MTSGVKKVKESFQLGEKVEPFGPFQDWVAHNRPVWSMDRLRKAEGWGGGDTKTVPDRRAS